VKSTAPGLLFTFEIYFYSLLFSDLLIQKQKNTLLQFIVIYFISRSCEIYLSNLLQFYLSCYPGGIDNPSFTSGCKYLFFVCRYHLCSVAWFSYWFDNLGLIIEGNTYRRCAASSLLNRILSWTYPSEGNFVRGMLNRYPAKQRPWIVFGKGTTFTKLLLIKPS